MDVQKVIRKQHKKINFMPIELEIRVGETENFSYLLKFLPDAPLT